MKLLENTNRRVCLLRDCYDLNLKCSLIAQMLSLLLSAEMFRVKPLEGDLIMRALASSMNESINGIIGGDGNFMRWSADRGSRSLEVCP
jgi:hypothetical protein